MEEVSDKGKRRRTDVPPPELRSSRPGEYTWGALDVEELLGRLTSEGILDAKHEPDAGGGCIIHLVSELGMGLIII